MSAQLVAVVIARKETVRGGAEAEVPSFLLFVSQLCLSDGVRVPALQQLLCWGLQRQLSARSGSAKVGDWAVTSSPFFIPS